MKFKKAVKLMAVCTTIAAGIGAAVYLIKDKMDCKSLSEDFDDDFEDDFEDFEEDVKPESRDYVNLNCHTAPAEDSGTPSDAASDGAEDDAGKDETEDASSEQ